MNWDAIGAIGEIIGALAVVGSLLYLGTQIRISNDATKQSAMREVLEQSATFLGRIGSDTSVASIWEKGIFAQGPLTSTEALQFGVLCLEITQIWERGYYLSKSSSIEEHLIYSLDSNLNRVSGAPGFQSWFKARGSTFSPEFYQLVLTKIENSEELLRWEDKGSQNGENET